jgi:hypothetical protein
VRPSRWSAWIRAVISSDSSTVTIRKRDSVSGSISVAVVVSRNIAGPLTVCSSVRMRPVCGSFVVTAMLSDFADCKDRIE